SLFADVVDAIKNNRKPSVDAEAGARALELVLAIYKSSFTGKPVKLPLDDCSTLDFINGFDKK
ncbi:MAG: Gfo/Idh/MocA family oxidoreductase, partial [Clostridia bacterium]